MTSIYGGQSDENYTAELVDGEVLALGAADTTASLAWVPVAPGSINITEGTKVYTDDGAGKLKEGATDAGTIDYATGALTFTTAPGAGTWTATYTYNNKYAPAAVPEVQLSIESLPIVAKDRTIKSLYSLSAALQFEKEYGNQIDALMAAEVAGELAHKQFVA